MLTREFRGTRTKHILEREEKKLTGWTTRSSKGDHHEEKIKKKGGGRVKNKQKKKKKTPNGRHPRTSNFKSEKKPSREGGGWG